MKVFQNIIFQEVVQQVRTSTDQLLVLFKRVSLDDDLDDNLRQELMMMMSVGAGESLNTLALVQTPGGKGAEDFDVHGQVVAPEKILEGDERLLRVPSRRFCSMDPRSKEEIHNAALEKIQRFLSKNGKSEEL